MMPIHDLDIRLRELGRIKLGDRAASGAPRRLSNFRFTSSSVVVIEALCQVYGGEVSEWEGPRGIEFQLMSEVSSIEVRLPMGDSLQTIQQFMELWKGSGCQRRCDGRMELLEMQACVCPQDPQERVQLAARGQACSPRTRLWLIIPELSTIGTWRLETNSYYAAVELAGSVGFIREAMAREVAVRVSLRIEQRSSITNGQKRRYSVPVLDAEMDFERLHEPVDRPALPRAAEVEQGAPELPATNGEHRESDIDWPELVEYCKGIGMTRQDMSDLIGGPLNIDAVRQWARGQGLTVMADIRDRIGELWPPRGEMPTEEHGDDEYEALQDRIFTAAKTAGLTEDEAVAAIEQRTDRPFEELDFAELEVFADEYESASRSRSARRTAAGCAT